MMGNLQRISETSRFSAIPCITMPYPVLPPEPPVANDLPQAEPAVHASVPFTAIAVAPTASAAAPELAVSSPESFVGEASSEASVSSISHSAADLLAPAIAQSTPDLPVQPPVPTSPARLEPLLHSSATSATDPISPTVEPLIVAQTTSIPTIPSPQPSPALERPDEQPNPPSESPATPTTPETPAIATFNVQQVEVTGSTVLSDADLNPIIQPLIGTATPLTELQNAADAITQLYLDRGYLTSRALDPDVSNGIARIRVVEGSIERIEIQGAQRIHEHYIRSRIRRAARTPLNTNRLEDQLRLLRSNPIFENIEASLRAGEQFGQSVVIVRVTEANPVVANVGVANDSPPSVGSERVSFDVTHRNLTGNADALGGYYRRSTTGGSESYGLTYDIPLNARDGTLQFQVERNRNHITQSPFDELGIRGGNTRVLLNVRQPLVRSPREEFALSLGFAFEDGQTFVFDNIPFPFGRGVEADGVSRTSVIQFGQDYVRRDRRGAWALRSQFNVGTGLFDATANEGSLPDGQFISWLGQAQRVQNLGKDHVLIIQADLQLTPDGLLPSQQLSIGGGQSVRGYRQNVRSGDNGFRFSVEDRIALDRDESGNPTLQLAPFLDMGAVWNDPDNPLPRDDNFLVGLGVGLLWNPVPRLNIRLDYGLPVITLGDRGDNAQDDGIYFRVNYRI
jgi:hemolysin activation/secretion protein